MPTHVHTLGALLNLLGRGVLSETDAVSLFECMRTTLGVDAIVIGQEWGRFGGFLRSTGVPKAWPETYARPADQDPARAFIAARPMGCWFFVRANSSAAEKEMELFQTFQRMGFHDAAITQLPSAGAPISLVLYRSGESDRDFDQEDRVLLEVLYPHFQQAFGRARSALAWRGDTAGERSLAMRELPHAHFDFASQQVEWSPSGRELFEALLHQPFDRARPRLDAMVRHAIAKDVGSSTALLADVRGEVLSLRDGAGQLEGAVLLFDRAAHPSHDETPRSPAEELLSPRQRLVARFAASGKSLREVGETLNLSTETARTHLKSVYERLGVSERSSLSHLLR